MGGIGYLLFLSNPYLAWFMFSGGGILLLGLNHTIVSLLPILAFAYKVLLDISRGKLFEKANQPRWRSLIPGWNMYKLATLAHKKRFFILGCILMFLFAVGWLQLMSLGNSPYFGYLMNISLILSVVFYCVVLYSLAKAFWRSSLFALGLVICPLIFFPILALSGDSIYQKNPIVPMSQPTSA